MKLLKGTKVKFKLANHVMEGVITRKVGKYGYNIRFFDTWSVQDFSTHKIETMSGYREIYRRSSDIVLK